MAASKKYKVVLDDDTINEFSTKEKAMTFFELTPSAVAVLAPAGKVVAGVYDPPVEEDAEPAEPLEPGYVEVGEFGGRFYRDGYNSEGATPYQRNPRSILRHEIGCTWGALAGAGLDDAKVARQTLEGLENGTINIEDLIDRAAEAAEEIIEARNEAKAAKKAEQAELAEVEAEEEGDVEVA